jgi:hypothetical protein
MSEKVKESKPTRQPDITEIADPWEMSASELPDVTEMYAARMAALSILMPRADELADEKRTVFQGTGGEAACVRLPLGLGGLFSIDGGRVKFEIVCTGQLSHMQHRIGVVDVMELDKKMNGRDGFCALIRCPPGYLLFPSTSTNAPNTYPRSSYRFFCPNRACGCEFRCTVAHWWEMVAKLIKARQSGTDVRKIDVSLLQRVA